MEGRALDFTNGTPTSGHQTLQTGKTLDQCFSTQNNQKNWQNPIKAFFKLTNRGYPNLPLPIITEDIQSYVSNLS
jgi:hypothetical protein